MDRGDEAVGRGPRVRLSSLVVLVVWSAMLLDVVRRARVNWGGNWPEDGRILELATLALGVGLGLVLLGEVVAHWRKRVTLWPLAWRGVVIAWVAWSSSGLIRDLTVDEAELRTYLAASLQLTMRMAAIPLSVGIGLVGVMLGLLPRQGVSKQSSPRWAWLSAVWAGLAGVAILGAGYGWLPYLVLLAMEAVENAMRGPLAPRIHHPFNDRMTTAGWDGAGCVVVCLVTAAWLARDLRLRAGTDPTLASRSRFGIVARIFSTFATAGAGLYAGGVAIPRLQPLLIEGITSLLDPFSIASVTMGFAWLAAGIVARSQAPIATIESEVRPEPAAVALWTWRALRYLAVTAVFVVALAIAAAALFEIRRDVTDRWYVPLSVRDWTRILQGPRAWFGPLSPTRANSIDYLDGPILLLLQITALWLTVRLIALAIGFRRPGLSPFDALVATQTTLGNFLGNWLALTTLMLAALPVLALAGTALVPHLIGWLSG